MASTSTPAAAMAPTSSSAPVSASATPTSSILGPAPSASAVSCPAADNTTQHTADGDYYNVTCGVDHDTSGNIGHSPQPSYEMCAFFCTSNPSCQAFAYVPTTPATDDNCFLKSTGGNATSSSTVWGGVLVPNPFGPVVQSTTNSATVPTTSTTSTASPTTVPAASPTTPTTGSTTTSASSAVPFTPSTTAPSTESVTPTTQAASAPSSSSSATPAAPPAPITTSMAPAHTSTAPLPATSSSIAPPVPAKFDDADDAAKTAKQKLYHGSQNKIIRKL
ncbi:hypothetical protein B0T22DRAFT_472630 [Podospora appendiculata]|uniref:Apple domain-containing protein n=1 Tax=Podospora appendiculata TaxID=314037 RepID=A0AAE1C7M1_9PEZI|nr:hypothetical protein B0T22DRAFT_472630 [Podospora appendiculata]